MPIDTLAFEHQMRALNTEDKKAKNMKTVQTLILTALFVQAYWTKEPINGLQDMKMCATGHHHKVKRVLSGKMNCFLKVIPYCQVFTYGQISKKFCIPIKVNCCTALD